MLRPIAVTTRLAAVYLPETEDSGNWTMAVLSFYVINQREMGDLGSCSESAGPSQDPQVDLPS